MAVNKRDLSTLEGETGWPVVNYAQEERNFQTSHNQRSGAISIPRFKFTWLVEFSINPRVWDNPVTNLKEFTQNGKLYTHLLSVDHPQPTIRTEKLRSYNKWINVPVQVEFPPMSMTFHDDSTSVVQALWKEHLNFYTHLAQVGDSISGEGTNSNLGSSQETNSYGFTHILTGEEMRAKMEERPSLGMKLKPNDMRHFFEYICIYDLGTEPDGINVYWFHKPMINGWQHENLDKEDRTGNVRVTATVDYESYYFTIGQNRGRIADYIQQVFGFVSDVVTSTPRKDGIARDGQQQPIAQRVENGSASNSLAAFPGEDDLIAQQAMAGGAGFQGIDASVAGAPFAEQLNSVVGLNSPAQGLKDALVAGGIDTATQSLNEATAQAFPLGTRPGTDLVPGPLVIQEPLAPSELRPEIPLDLGSKQNDLDQVRRQKQALLDTSNDRPLTTDEKVRLGDLAFREDDLDAAIGRQKQFQQSQFTSTPATSSALANTQAKQGLTTASNSPTVGNTKEPLVIRITGDAADAAQDRVDNLNAELSRNRQQQSELRRRGAAQDVEPFKALRAEQAELEAARTAEEKNVADLLAQRPSG